MSFSKKTQESIVKTKKLREDLKEAVKGINDHKPFTVIVLQGDKVWYHGTHDSCVVNHTREVTPKYRIGYESWGQVDSLQVEPGSECVTILASKNVQETAIAGKHDFKK